MAVEIIVPVAFFLFIFGVVFVIVTARNRERMAIIDKGFDASLLYRENKKSAFIRYGFTLVGLGLGSLVGIFIEQWINKPNMEGVIIASILVFGGLFMILGYLVEMKIQKKNEQELL
ncbi:hypothetical protein MASR1M45_25400 [Candidatus Kapaibacterium sp.]